MNQNRARQSPACVSAPESWKPSVTGYEVSDQGRVRVASNQRLLTPRRWANGAPRVRLAGVWAYVHTLVAQAFAPNVPASQVGWKDQDRGNCAAVNLYDTGTQATGYRGLRRHVAMTDQQGVITRFPSIIAAARAIQRTSQVVKISEAARKNDWACGRKWRFVEDGSDCI